MRPAQDRHRLLDLACRWAKVTAACFSNELGFTGSFVETVTAVYRFNGFLALTGEDNVTDNSGKPDLMEGKTDAIDPHAGCIVFLVIFVGLFEKTQQLRIECFNIL